MRKTIITALAFAALAAGPALAQRATEGALTGAAVGAGAGFAVGGPVGAAVGAGVGGTVGASAGDTNRREGSVTVVEPAPSVSERTCATDSYGNRTCTEVRR